MTKFELSNWFWSRDFSKPIRGLKFWRNVNLSQNFLYKMGSWLKAFKICTRKFVSYLKEVLHGRLVAPRAALRGTQSM